MMAGEGTMDDLPELLYEDLTIGKEFPVFEYSITTELVSAFVRATGDDNPLYKDETLCKGQGFQGVLAPSGLAGIFGRLSYLQHRRMPPGGVLARQDMEFYGPFYVGETLKVKARVVDRFTKNERRFVVIESEAESPEGRKVALVRVMAIWPK